MGFMDGLKALVTKGPGGLTDVMMKDQLDWTDRYNAADKTDPVVMKALMEEQKQKMNASMDRFGMNSFMPSDMKARMNAVMDNAGENTAAMHQVLEAQKAKMRAEEEAKTGEGAGGLPPLK